MPYPATALRQWRLGRLEDRGDGIPALPLDPTAFADVESLCFEQEYFALRGFLYDCYLATAENNDNALAQTEACVATHLQYFSLRSDLHERAVEHGVEPTETNLRTLLRQHAGDFQQQLRALAYDEP